MTRVALLASALAALAPAVSSAEAPDRSFHSGIALGLQPFNLNSVSFIGGTAVVFPSVALYAPIDVASVRIEPSIGFATFSENSSSAFAGQPTSGHDWALGLGALYKVVAPAPVGFYIGGRLGVAFVGATTAGPSLGSSTSVSETDVSLHLAGGGEYAVAPQFTVGAELQAGITWYGDPKVSPSVGTTISRGLTSWSTNGLLFLRYFFV